MKVRVLAIGTDKSGLFEPAIAEYARRIGRYATLETLELRRQEYLRIADISPHFATVDASQTPDGVAAEVAAHIHRFAQDRSSAPPRVFAEAA